MTTADYTLDIVPAIAAVDAVAWDGLCREAGAGVFMDRRFVAAVEAGMGHVSRFRHVVVRDRAGSPVACACLSTFRVNVADVADPALAAIVQRLPAVVQRMTSVAITFCGLPVSAGQSQLAIAPSADRGRLVRQLDALLLDAARADGASLVCFKEFDDRDPARSAALRAAGYSVFAAPPMHLFPPVFRDLAQYRAALTAHYRREVTVSLQKAERAGLETVVLDDAAEIRQAYSADVHRLYLDVVARSTVKLETLSHAFFLALADHLHGDVRLIALRRGGRVVAFAWLVQSPDEVCNLFVGLDYAGNRDCDLYFNIMFAALNYALQQGVRTIQIGQTADAFKSRLGCSFEPREVFIKGVGRAMGAMLRHVIIRTIQTPAPVPAFRVYRTADGPRARPPA